MGCGGAGTIMVFTYIYMDWYFVVGTGQHFFDISLSITGVRSGTRLKSSSILTLPASICLGSGKLLAKHCAKMAELNKI